VINDNNILSFVKHQEYFLIYPTSASTPTGRKYFNLTALANRLIQFAPTHGVNKSNKTNKSGELEYLNGFSLAKINNMILQQKTIINRVHTTTQ